MVRLTVVVSAAVMVKPLMFFLFLLRYCYVGADTAVQNAWYIDPESCVLQLSDNFLAQAQFNAVFYQIDKNGPGGI
jgi:hypothetical protein